VEGIFLSHYLKVSQAINHSSESMSKIKLGVPYYGRRNTTLWESDPLGFSSICAMAAEFIRPGCLIGTGERDDRYLKMVREFGNPDTVEAQIHALEGLGIGARLHHNGDLPTLIASLMKGIPVPVYWLFNGNPQCPTDGRWTLAVGWDKAARELIMHDPLGRPDLDRGGFISTAIGEGSFSRFKKGRFCSRWMTTDHRGVRRPGTYLQLSKI
jgi:hypothetical protein